MLLGHEAFIGYSIDILNMSRATADEKILSYNDVVLRRSDLDILSGPYFLNDRIIEFYFSYLTSCYSSEDILLVPPSIAFWIKECPDVASLKDFVEPLHLSQKKLIIFPINDNADVSMAEGGSHWSLLAFERNANVFVHHDSSGGINGAHAKRVYRTVVSYIASSDAKYVECSSTPKQVNGYDCGLYVTAIARAICDWYQSDGLKNLEDLWFSTIKEQITPSFVSKMRNDMLELVRSLMAKQ
ncbi:Sentrin-specific cysteine protease (Ulp1 family) [Handroanthus impetiginosus]|uniref:Sentrin-specific cysteine protease (Ulp1 family) n=1 Tax=Handroanthus impetiginosus TaxID=429701 RepID=A0A2G9G856_9LAMI|nr:Sentrin-specific cysteine protease (Ulp1 family) [Handroanthus impetiginosus]